MMLSMTLESPKFTYSAFWRLSIPIGGTGQNPDFFNLPPQFALLCLNYIIKKSSE